MDGEGAVTGFIFGLATMWGYQHWNTPIVIQNAEEQISGSVALTKMMSGQVALIHGFIDDFEVCRIVQNRLETDGGTYGCVFAEQVASNSSY